MREDTQQRMTIAASPQACYDAALDYEAYPTWASDIKDATIVVRDDDGRGGEVEYRAAAMGRSTTYRLRYNYGSNPLRVSWRLVDGDIMRALEGQYVFDEVPGDPDSCDVTYELSVEMIVPLPGFVKRRAETKIIHTAIEELKQHVE